MRHEWMQIALQHRLLALGQSEQIVPTRLGASCQYSAHPAKVARYANRQTASRPEPRQADDLPRADRHVKAGPSDQAGTAIEKAAADDQLRRLFEKREYRQMP
jgi:hypothetical protein